METKETGNLSFSMKMPTISMQLYLMVVKRLEYLEMPCQKPLQKTSEIDGQNLMLDGHLRGPILPLCTQRVLHYGVDLDFKKLQGCRTLVSNLLTIPLVKNTSSPLVPTLTLD